MFIRVISEGDPYVRGCEHKSKKVVDRKVMSVEDVPAYGVTITKNIYEMLYECKDSGGKWTEANVDTKFDRFFCSDTIWISHPK